jgi:hypothetical protein
MSVLVAARCGFPSADDREAAASSTKMQPPTRLTKLPPLNGRLTIPSLSPAARLSVFRYQFGLSTIRYEEGRLMS